MAASAPVPRSRRRISGRWAALLIGGLAIVAVAFTLGRMLDGAIDPPPPAAPPPAQPTGLDRGSYLRPENMRAALARMRGQGRVQSVRIEPALLTARLLSTQRRVVWNLRAGRPPQRVVGPPYDDFNTTVAFSQIDPDAPARFARAAAALAGRDVSDVDFLFLQRNLGRPRWILYFEGGLHYTADRHGGHVERG
jgi:hypothetical protein